MKATLRHSLIMKKFFSSFIALSLISAWAVVRAETSPEQLADKAWRASGGENWANVKTIDFTFNVQKDGKTLGNVEHHWDVAAQTDQVKWKGKDVTVNLANPGTDENSKAAYARWVNDSYWLLAPLKLKERGVKVADGGMKEMDGVKCQVLQLSFESVGLTPKDSYNLYLDPQSGLLTSWDYMPEPGKMEHMTWTDYQKSGGLTIATDHSMDNGATHIRILNLKVTTVK
jgi:hypothetical protein